MNTTGKRKWEIDAMVRKIERESLEGIPVDAEKVAAAERLGREAFERGGVAAPVLDPKLMALLAGNQAGESIPVLEAWNRGWTEANLAVPFEF